MVSKRSLGLVFLLSTVLLLLTGFTEDYSRPWDRVGTFVEGAAPQSVDRLTQSCPPAYDDHCAYNYPLLRETCDVRETKELGVFGEEQYLAVRYLRSRTFDQGEGRQPFACTADEIVLAALPGGGRARIVWRDATERAFVFISSVKLYGTPGGERILSVLYCMNGTGGCAQGLLIWAVDAWQRLERDESWVPVYRNLPAGYRPHKSPEIDLGNLTLEEHLAHENDANCCPSGRIHFDLAIIDRKLAVKSYRIVVPATEAIERATGRLMATLAWDLDRALPGDRFDSWLDLLLPTARGRLFEAADCAAPGENPEGRAGSGHRPCIAVEVVIDSRDRNVRLLFERQSLRFLGGEMVSRDLGGRLNVPSLAELPDLLAKAMAVTPLRCPPGTEPKRKEEYAGLYEWCENRQGKRHGPYRSWFSTGLYLMEKGAYEDGGKSGEWTQCDRFETCVARSYGKDPG